MAKKHSVSVPKNNPTKPPYTPGGHIMGPNQAKPNRGTGAPIPNRPK